MNGLIITSHPDPQCALSRTRALADSAEIASHPPTDAELLRRRAAALKMRAQGHTLGYIAQRLNVSENAVVNWTLGKQRGTAPRTFANPPAGPLEPPQLGRAPYLTDDQLRALVKDGEKRPMTGNAFRAAIRSVYGVSYSLSHACGLLRFLRGVGETRYDARLGKANRASGASA